MQKRNDNINKLACIEQGAVIGENTVVGPFSYIGPNVKIGNNVIIHNNVSITGHTTIGDGNEIFPFAAIGCKTQDKKYAGEFSSIIIGSGNQIREHATIHPGAVNPTTIGDNNLLMVGSHIAHDCILGHNIVMANNATLAGHVVVEDHAILGGLCAVHQFVRIGKYSIIGGMSPVDKDVIPFGNVRGQRANLVGLNLIGMRRKKFSAAEIAQIDKVYKRVFLSKDNSFSERVQEMKNSSEITGKVDLILDFLCENRDRALCMPAE